MRSVYLAILCFLMPSLAYSEEVLHQTSNWIECEKLVLRGLDKISARVFTSEVMINQKIHFGSLEIYVRNASRSPPEDQPESACFLEIFDNKPGQQRQKVFSGWMFSSNPALSALEHPVYDIWIKEVILPPQTLDAAVTEEAPAEPKPATSLVTIGPQTKKGTKPIIDDDSDLNVD
jgi:hypothetical protein